MNNILSFASFIETLHRDKTLSGGPVLSFKGKSYPLLFFSLLMQWLRTSGTPVTTIDLKNSARHDAQRQLETAFLGQLSLFWLGSLSDLSAAEYKFWISYVRGYVGPNTLLFFVEDDSSLDQPDALIIPQTLSTDLTMHLYTLLYGENIRAVPFFKKVLQHTKELSVDQACLLMQYERVMGRNGDQIIQEIVPLIIAPQGSLFTLSDAVLQKNKKLALALWSTMRDSFSIQFWISYWSEQTWRAYWYIALMRAGRVADAKKVAYRLPYSFIQKVWRSCDPEQLRKAHALLYETDTAIKNGLHPEGMTILDLVCLQLMESKSV